MQLYYIKHFIVKIASRELKKRKAHFLAGFAPFLFLVSIISAQPVLAQTVFLDPPTATVLSQTPFSLILKIDSTTNLFAVNFDLNFDPSLIEYAGIQEGDFLKQGCNTVLMTNADTPGKLIFGLTRLGASCGGVSGSGTIAALNFRSLDKIGTVALSFSSNSLCILSGTSCNYTIGAWNPATVTIDNPDTMSPVRSNGLPSGVLPAGTTQTTISLATNENATCRFSTTAGTVYSSMTNTFSITGQTNHSTMVSSLQDGHSYNYYVKCVDGTNNANSDDFTISFSIASIINTCSLSVFGSPVRYADGKLTWIGNSSPTTGYKIKWYGTKNGVQDENGGDYGQITNFTWVDGPWTSNSFVGDYTRYFKAFDSSGNIVCTSNTVNVSIVAANTQTTCNDAGKPSGNPPSPWWSPRPTTAQQYIDAICGSGSSDYQVWCSWFQTRSQCVPSSYYSTSNSTASPLLLISASFITSNFVTITWTTNESSDSQVEYGLTANYGSQTTLSTAMITYHSQIISGLSPSTLYHYRVKSRDAAGNLAVSGDYTFTTQFSYAYLSGSRFYFGQITSQAIPGSQKYDPNNDGRIDGIDLIEVGLNFDNTAVI